MRTRGLARAPALAAAMAARCFFSLAGFLCSAHTCTACVMVGEMVDDVAASDTRTASPRNHAAAARSTAGGSVADASVTRGGRRVRALSLSTCSPRPMASILSASSRTRVVVVAGGEREKRRV